MTDKFTVWSFFKDGTHEPDGPPVEGEAAVKRAHGIINSVGGKLGFVIEVRIVDTADECIFHWTKEGGILFPTPEDCARAKG